MSFKPVKARAEELLSYGIGKQQVYHYLVQEFPEAKPKRIAEELRYRATEADRERYRDLHRLLLGLIVASAVWRIGAELMQGTPEPSRPWTFLALVPIATLLVGYSLLLWQGHMFQWVGWANALGVFGLLKEVGGFIGGEVDPRELVPKLLSVSIGVITLYLAHHVFAKPQEVKDPMNGAPTSYLFPDDQAIQ